MIQLGYKLMSEEHGPRALVTNACLAEDAGFDFSALPDQRRERSRSMKVLVTGGTGVIGEGLIPHLLRAGLEVRILSRDAAEGARPWPEHVEPFPADVADVASLRGAAEGCQAVVHITGILKETPPRETFEAVNVEGTRQLVAEANRAGVERFIYISSLGAERGRSEYHQSKRRAEAIVREEFLNDWVVLRAGNVYGPGDEVISTLLRMLRVLPILPVVASGHERFQPIWFEDLGAAVAKVIARDDLCNVTLEVAGEERTTTNDLLDRLAKLTGRNPPRIGVPSWLLSLAARAAKALGVQLPIDQQKLTMLLEENVIDEASSNALVETLGLTPTRLSDGLAALVDLQPEQTPGHGVGSIERKRFWADIAGPGVDALALMDTLKSEISEIMPIDFAAEPGASTELSPGATMTAELPLRGTVQMRVEECSGHHVSLATLRGHPLAGLLRFSTADLEAGGLRFEVVAHAQAASIADWMALKTAAGPAQDATWTTVVERMVERSGGRAAKGVETEKRTLHGGEATDVEKWIRDLIVERKREERGGESQRTTRPRSESQRGSS